MTTWILATGPVGLGTRDRSRLETLLGSLLGTSIEVRPYLTYTELLDAVVTRVAHLAWLGPALLVRGRARCELEPLVRAERESGASYRAALFVLPSSELRVASDLAGARFAWVDPSSCAGYLYPRLALQRAGVDVDEALGTERFVGSYGAVMRAVETGAVDVGAAYVETEDVSDASAPILRAAWSDHGLDARAILVTDPVPADVVVATSALGAVDRARVRRELLALHETDEGAAILRSLFHARALREVAIQDYDAVVVALQAAGEALD
ncbi:MAG: phosphate/phosphite/phosphonate ABC transporter substrate-binding protein [Myxococcota bacterium]|nr:phosphate/phosphite/phosphonate ABC transporter substrate-binding protein [Myxococcota bacterium]